MVVVLLSPIPGPERCNKTGLNADRLRIGIYILSGACFPSIPDSNTHLILLIHWNLRLLSLSALPRFTNSILSLLVFDPASFLILGRRVV